VGYSHRGFTLIELLIVIAILAVLSVAVVLVLNPAELLRQGRDSTRLSDLAAIRKAIILYLADIPSPNLKGAMACSSAFASCTFATNTSPFANGSGTGCGSGPASTTVAVNGTGWLPVNLAAISGGSPLARLPIDPNNGGASAVSSTLLLYGYACGTGSSLNFEIDANMESGKYSAGGGADVETKDGGDKNDWYEIGNSLTQ
jgi:prepilin-type N-terminal cleavage/methylation domain-containing protein